MLVCGLRAHRPPKDRPCVALSAAAQAPAPQVPLSAVCVVLLKGRSPQIIPSELKECREQYFFSCFFPFIRLTYPPPSASGYLKNSLGALLFTHSPSSARLLFIPPPVFTFDKETVRSLFSLPRLACCYYGEPRTCLLQPESSCKMNLFLIHF